ncbi:MAG: hypothetical protein NW220_16595 [Leptolyngbyaceae cyanobacterium bins.349]|nr:hypothetical protein [Leptolyngbyaceae cyanobacterium bins.349]
MRLFQGHFRRVGWTVGAGAAIAAGFIAFEYFRPPNGCVRTLYTGGKASSGQEVVYSWGCFHPQRFRQWSITASVPQDDSSNRRVRPYEADRWAVVAGTDDRRGCRQVSRSARARSRYWP